MHTIFGRVLLLTFCNSHRIKVYSINKSRQATAERLKYIEDMGLSLEPITQPLEVDLESDEHYDAEVAAMGGRDPKE